LQETTLENKVSLKDVPPGILDPFSGVISGTSGNYDWEKYNPPARLDLNPDRGIRVLAELSLEDLYAFGDAYGEDAMSSSGFMFALRDAMVLMMQRIIERHPKSWQFHAPSSFPEREIYDSVLGIMEDDDIDVLNVALGGSSVEAERVSKRLFSSLDSLLIEHSGHTINIPGVGKTRFR
jgi:hypothetical protein